MEEVERLPFFVYGTLQTGYKNHANVINGRLDRFAAAFVRGFTLYHFPAGFPGMYRAFSPTSEVVYGQLLYLPPADFATLLTELDKLEEYYGEGSPRNEYLREVVECTTLEGGSAVRAYAYTCAMPLSKLPGAEHVEGGNWRAYMEKMGKVDAADDWKAKSAELLAEKGASAGGASCQ